MGFNPINTDFALLPPDPGLINPDLTLDAALAPVEDFAPDAPRAFGGGWGTVGILSRQGRLMRG